MNTKDTDYSFRLEYVNKQGQREKIYNGISYDPYTQIMSGNWKFETLDENGNVIGERIHPLKMRQTYRQEMKYILEMCGIKIGTDNRVTISPNPGGHFEYARLEYDSIYGTIICGWKKTSDGKYEYEVVVPPNVKADVVLPE